MYCIGAIKPAYPACGLILPLYIKPENPKVYYSTIADKNSSIVGFQRMIVDENRIIRLSSKIARVIGEEELVCFYYKKADDHEWFYINTLEKLTQILIKDVENTIIPIEARWRMQELIGSDELKKRLASEMYEYLAKIDQDYAKEWLEENEIDFLINKVKITQPIEGNIHPPKESKDVISSRPTANTDVSNSLIQLALMYLEASMNYKPSLAINNYNSMRV